MSVEMKDEDHHHSNAELRSSVLSNVLFRAYRLRYIRGLCEALSLRLEGGQFFSATLRRILAHYHGVEAGAYSYGEGLKPGAFPRGVRIGRYTSIAPGVRVLVRNHPLNHLSLHPFFYNSSLGFVKEDLLPAGTLSIGADAWIGERAIIAPGCRQIGIGAVVGAGAIVTHDVPDFAIVAGNPARLIRYRFDEATQTAIKASRWWEHPIDRCAAHLSEMTRPLGSNPTQHPLLRNLAGSRDTELELPS